MGRAECHQEAFLFSIIMVSSFPIYSQVLGQVSSLRYGFHLIERALNPIKIMVFIHSHKICATTVPVCLEERSLLHVTGIVAGSYYYMDFYHSPPVTSSAMANNL